MFNVISLFSSSFSPHKSEWISRILSFFIFFFIPIPPLFCSFLSSSESSCFFFFFHFLISNSVSNYINFLIACPFFRLLQPPSTRCRAFFLRRRAEVSSTEQEFRRICTGHIFEFHLLPHPFLILISSFSLLFPSSIFLCTDSAHFFVFSLSLRISCSYWHTPSHFHFEPKKVYRMATMRSILVILLLLALFAQTTEAAKFGSRHFQPKYFRYRRWDPTHDFYDDYEVSRLW